LTRPAEHQSSAVNCIKN